MALDRLGRSSAADRSPPAMPTFPDEQLAWRHVRSALYGSSSAVEEAAELIAVLARQQLHGLLDYPAFLDTERARHEIDAALCRDGNLVARLHPRRFSRRNHTSPPTDLSWRCVGVSPATFPPVN